ncbi:retrovirus-related pol polyprotein from transposon TNT 1-94 [Tanacetum coccineum]|uniref:Retrovirus-related pol polyprotein from transposon TNT 1-94 n=1 Tax=Tanacetum coccineum TaxID=301880 RepID=A0ABQ5EZC5_9ASTR
MVTQPTDAPLGNNTKIPRSITEPLVPDVTQSHISNQASTSSHPAPQDRWSRDQHIKLVNIIGNPGEGMLTRSMADMLTAASASECLFADFLSEIEPKKVSEALKHPRWIDAMQEELNQFYRNKVWNLIPLPYRKIAIVARMEAIRIFLAFATYMNFKFYLMDVKSAFLNGKVKEEVYVKQPPGFESSEFPYYVCKLDKALYGLKQAPRACSSVKTLMVPPSNLGPDLVGKSVNETSYRGMIGSLMYLTATRPDIQFSKVLCVRYQSNTKESHLTSMKRILMYLKVAMSLAEAEYVASAGCCVLGGNYSSTEQLNSFQQLLAYSLIIGTEVDIGEIIYSDLVTKLLNKSRLKYVSYPRFISCALQVLLGSEYTQDKKFRFLPPISSNSNFTKDPSKVTDIELTAHMIAVNNQRDSVSLPPLVAKPKKGKSQTVASTLPKSQGPKASRALSKKSKRPNSKKKPIETKPTEGSEQTHSVSSGIVPDPQDLERDIQPHCTGLLPHSMEWHSDGVVPGTKPLQLQTFADIQAYLLFEDALDKDNDEEEVLAAGDDMDEDIQAAKEVRTPSPKQDQPEPSQVQEYAFDSSKAAVSYADLKASIEQYYAENLAHRDQTDKLVEASMSSLDRSSTTISDLYKGLDVITLL